MLGLGGYGSSDEDESGGGARHARNEAAKIHGPASDIVTQSTNGNTANAQSRDVNEKVSAGDLESFPTVVTPATPDNGSTFGPVVGPQGPPDASPTPSNEGSSVPQSPYSSSRALVRDLTLPPVPNLEIPPSPPGSPPPRTTAKFARFLELKKQGVHFNDKLAKSSALKNPSLLQKLTGFAGMDERAQYASTLPKEMWDPDAFPSWAYKDELAKSQQEVQRRKEEERARTQREALDFVPASASGNSSRTGTPGGGSSGRGLGKSAAERVMAGLDGERTRSPASGDGPKGREADRRGAKLDSYRSRRDRSRSTSRERRRRSRSR